MHCNANTPYTVCLYSVTLIYEQLICNNLNRLVKSRNAVTVRCVRGWSIVCKCASLKCHVTQMRDLLILNKIGTKSTKKLLLQSVTVR